MTTPRTTMKTGPGSKSRAAPMSKPKRVAPHARALAMEMPAPSPEFQKGLRRAKRRAAELAETSKVRATAAWKIMRRSMKEAIAASKVATNKLAKRVAAATAPEKPAHTAKRRATKPSHGLTL